MKILITNLCVITTFIYCLTSPYEIAYYTSAALKLCVSAVIPSLFIFIVLSRIISHTIKNTNIQGRTLLYLSRIFGLPPSLLPICLCGLFCGAPSCTVGIGELYKSGLCSKDEAERALVLSNNCSAAFILSIVSSALSSTAGAIIILFSNITAVIIVYFLLFAKNRSYSASSCRNKQNNKYFQNIISDSISSSVSTILTLCGYVIFFYCLSSVISAKLWSVIMKISNNKDFAVFIKSAVCSLFEMTTGVLTASSLSGNIKLLMTSGSVAFCGLSVIFQVKSVANSYNLSCINFIYSKIICAFLSPLLTLVTLFIIPREVSAVNTFTVKTTGGFTSDDLIVLAFITCVCFAGAYLLSYLDKKHKN